MHEQIIDLMYTFLEDAHAMIPTVSPAETLYYITTSFSSFQCHTIRLNIGRLSTIYVIFNINTNDLSQTDNEIG